MTNKKAVRRMKDKMWKYKKGNYSPTPEAIASLDVSNIPIPRLAQVSKKDRIIA